MSMSYKELIDLKLNARSLTPLPHYKEYIFSLKSPVTLTPLPHSHALPGKKLKEEEERRRERKLGFDHFCLSFLL